MNPEAIEKPPADPSAVPPSVGGATGTPAGTSAPTDRGGILTPPPAVKNKGGRPRKDGLPPGSVPTKTPTAKAVPPTPEQILEQRRLDQFAAETFVAALLGGLAAATGRPEDALQDSERPAVRDGLAPLLELHPEYRGKTLIYTVAGATVVALASPRVARFLAERNKKRGTAPTPGNRSDLKREKLPPAASDEIAPAGGNGSGVRSPGGLVE